jgi:hypothetical protein
MHLSQLIALSGMRHKALILLLLFFSAMQNGYSQSWEITITDNLAKMNMEQRCRITPDSLIITGKSDYGRSNVDYLRRLLTQSERKLMQQWLRTFPIDSLRPVYFNDYSNFSQIDEENYPRSIDIELIFGEKKVSSKATNAWVALYNRLFETVNPMLPAEVKVNFDRSQFNVFY